MSYRNHYTLEQLVEKTIDNLVKRTNRNYEAHLLALYKVIRRRIYEIKEPSLEELQEWHSKDSISE